MQPLTLRVSGFKWPRSSAEDYSLAEDGARIVLRDVSRRAEYPPDRGTLEALIGSASALTVAALSQDVDDGEHFVPKATSGFAEAALDFGRHYGFLTAPRGATAESVEDFRSAWWGLYMTAHVSDPDQGWRLVPVRPFKPGMLDWWERDQKTFSVRGRVLHRSLPEFADYIEQRDALRRIREAKKQPLEARVVLGRRLRALADRSRFGVEVVFEGGEPELWPRTLQDFLWIKLTEREVSAAKQDAGLEEVRCCVVCGDEFKINPHDGRQRNAKTCGKSACYMHLKRQRDRKQQKPKARRTRRKS